MIAVLGLVFSLWMAFECWRRGDDYDSDRLLWNLARCEARRGKLNEARPLYEFFLTKHSYSEAQLEYANLLVQLGEEAEGRTLIEELLADIAASPRMPRRAWRMGNSDILLPSFRG